MDSKQHINLSNLTLTWNIRRRLPGTRSLLHRVNKLSNHVDRRWHLNLRNDLKRTLKRIIKKSIIWREWRIFINKAELIEKVASKFLRSNLLSPPLGLPKAAVRLKGLKD